MRSFPREKRTPGVGPDGVIVDEGRSFVTGCGEVLLNVHDASVCEGRPCVIHNPSDHPMREFRTHFRGVELSGIKPPHMERICPHGIGHPDPDDFRYEEVAVHGCDGCCEGLVDSIVEGGT